MNKEAQDYLNQILQKDLNDLNETHIRFLRARRAYLSAEGREKYAHLIRDAQDELTLLKEEAKKIGIKGAHFYTDSDKLKQKILEVQQQATIN